MFRSLWKNLMSRFDLDRRPAARRLPARNRRVQLQVMPLEERALMTAGAIDNTFGFGGKGLAAFDDGGQNGDTAAAMAIQPDGKIVVVGKAEGPNDNLDFAIARFLADGTPDPNFGDNGKVRVAFDGGGTNNDEAYAVAIQPDGKIVVAGQTDTSVPDIDMALIRLNTNGSLDDGSANDSTPGDDFNADGKISIFFDLGGQKYDVARAVTIKGDRIVVAGYAQTGATDFDMAVAQLDFAGNLDNAFSPGGNGTDGGSGRTIVTFDLGALNIDEAHAVAVQGDKILIAGTAHTAANGVDMAIARLDSAGALDATFSPGGTEGSGKAIVGFNLGGTNFDGLDAMAVQPDGKIVLAGSVSLSATNFDFGIARLLPGGGLDTADFGFGDGKTSVAFDFGGNNDDKAKAVAVQPDGKIVVAGTVQVGAAGNFDFAVVRLTTAGGLDGTFDGDGKATIAFNLGDTDDEDADKAAGMALDVDGRVVVAGTVHRTNTGDTDFGAARLLSDVPKAPSVLLPASSEILNQSTRGILGSAAAGSLVRVFRDVNNNNQVDPGEAVVGQQQLAAGATVYIVIVPLIEGTANNFLVQAATVNGDSPLTDVPTITDEGIVPKLIKKPNGRFIVRVNGSLTGAVRKILGPYRGPGRISLQDFNLDGTLDLVVRSFTITGKRRLQVFNGNGLTLLFMKVS